MSNYNTETVNVQFLNMSFLDKIDQGMTKEAGVAMSAFVRQKLREDARTPQIIKTVRNGGYVLAVSVVIEKST